MKILWCIKWSSQHFEDDIWPHVLLSDLPGVLNNVVIWCAFLNIEILCRWNRQLRTFYRFITIEKNIMMHQKLLPKSVFWISLWDSWFWTFWLYLYSSSKSWSPPFPIVWGGVGGEGGGYEIGMVHHTLLGAVLIDHGICQGWSKVLVFFSSIIQVFIMFS